MYKPGDRKYKNEWFPLNDHSLPVRDGNYMVTVLNNSIYETHEAVFIKSSGIFVDPVEEWEIYHVIAWSYMPHPFIPNLQIPMEIK